jgi:hypothetical protein
MLQVRSWQLSTDAKVGFHVSYGCSEVEPSTVQMEHRAGGSRMLHNQLLQPLPAAGGNAQRTLRRQVLLLRCR